MLETKTDELIKEFQKQVKKKTLQTCYHTYEENAVRLLKKLFKDEAEKQEKDEWNKKFNEDFDFTEENFKNDFKERLTKGESFEVILSENLEEILDRISKEASDLENKDSEEKYKIIDSINKYTKSTFEELMKYRAFDLVLNPSEGDSGNEFYKTMYKVLDRVEEIDDKITSYFYIRTHLKDIIELYFSIKAFILYNEEDEILTDKTRIKGKFDKAHEQTVQEIKLYLKAKDYFSKNKIERKKALLEDIYSRRVDEIDIIADSGIFSDIIKGYCLYALEEARVKDAQIDFEQFFGNITASKARKKGEDK